MLGIRILLHAIRMVTDNPGPALRISVVPMAVLLAATLALGGASTMFLDPESAARPGRAGAMAVLMLLQLGATLWIAVGWHRYILLEEAPEGFIPRFHGAAMLSYLWAGIIFSLVLMLVAIPFALLAGLIVGPVVVADQGAVRGPVGLILFLLVWLPVAYISYRISPILPSAATGKRLPLNEAWYATGTGGGAFLVLAVASVLLVWVLNLPTGILTPVSVPLALIWAFAVQWAVTLVGASVLTTIHGHFVEKRELHA
ncbi:hypothetical protein [Pararhodobacter sp. SW119]|uniref:hypothetical protein n=1 Tax=Pararhodobacter sp. SW119 TaxID=2780075 RepID=UPI001AE0645A|nr:hypothetical protein [Pararhodobacter sp. SW119]